YLTYRFGNPDKVELEFPASHDRSYNQFRFAHYFRYQVDQTEVTFNNGDYAYTIFQYYEGDTGKIERSSGVSVEGKDSNMQQILCNEPPLSHLSDLQEVLPCDKDSPLNLDNCPD